MRTGNTVHLYVAAEEVDACAVSFKDKTQVTISGLHYNGKRAKVTGVVLNIEIGHQRFENHETLVTVLVG